MSAQEQLLKFSSRLSELKSAVESCVAERNQLRAELQRAQAERDAMVQRQYHDKVVTHLQDQVKGAWDARVAALAERDELKLELKAESAFCKAAHKRADDAVAALEATGCKPKEES